MFISLFQLLSSLTFYNLHSIKQEIQLGLISSMRAGRRRERGSHSNRTKNNHLAGGLWQDT